MAQKRKIVELEDVEEPHSKKLRLDVKTTTSFRTAHLTLSFSSLPLEIFGHHILKFFDFRDWLKLVVVCKQWQASAQQSTFHKQLVYREKLEEPVACSIISKYRVNTLVINTDITHQQLERLLASSPSITTLVTDSGNIRQELYARDFRSILQRSKQYPQITTLSTSNSDLLQRCPNVTKLRLLSHQDIDRRNRYYFIEECIPYYTCPSVQEIEININNTQQSDVECFEAIKRAFPSLTKLYANYDTTQSNKRMEEIGQRLHFTIFHDNPHLSRDVNDFSLKSLSYHEYFNGFGKTPLQNYLQDNKDISRELFTKYSSKQYEKDLYRREPQFNFPLRCPEFTPNTSKALLLQLDRSLLLTMVECRYVHYWQAIGISSLLSRTKDRTIALLRQSVNYMPPTHHAVQSIPHILSKTNLSLHDVTGAISSEVFNLILTLRSKNGDTMLHYCAKERILCRSELYELFERFIDFREENCKNENAATVAFNHKCWNHWQRLVAGGAEVQSHLYKDFAAKEFLKGVVLSDSQVSTPSFIDQRLAQQLLWLLVGYEKENERARHQELLCQDDPLRYVEIFAKLVRLGANPRDRSYGTTLVCIMTETKRMNWSLIEQYKLDINGPNQRGLTPLMISIQNGSYSQAEHLLMNGADPNVRTTDFQGRTKCAVFLLLEVKVSVQQYINLLQQYNTDFTVEDECGNTIINRAAAHHGCEVDTYIHLAPIDKPNHYGFTPLATAINQRSTHTVEVLIAGGADPNITAGPLKQPPFVLALESGCQGTIFELLSCRKVDLRIKDRVNRSFIYYLFKIEQYNFLNVLLGAQNGLLVEILRDYNTPENIEFIKSELAVVLSAPELSRHKTNLMLTALHSFPLLMFLIDVLGIDINTEDQNGDTMLLMVDNYTQFNAVEFLLARGANVNLQNKQGNTALMLAIENRIVIQGSCQPLIQLLIKSGASLTIENIWGVSPLKADPSLMSFLFIK